MKKDKLVSYSQLAKVRREVLDKILPLKAPLSLFIEPTNLCNYHCVMCPLYLPDYRKIAGYSGNMSLELYKKIIKDIKTLGRLKSLKLYCDGEPLVNKNIVEMVKLAKKENIAERIEITSNGSLLNKDLSRELIESGLDYLRISISSVYESKKTEINHSKITVKQLFNKIKYLRNFRDTLQQKSPFIYVKMIDTFSKENEVFIKMYQEIADEVFIEPPMNWNGQRDFLTNLYHNGKKKIDISVKEKREVCPFPFYSLVIKCNGDVVACCVDWSKKTKIGNLKQQSLAEVWRGQSLKDFQTMHLERRRRENESCQNCTFLDTARDNIDCLTEKKIAEILKP